MGEIGIVLIPVLAIIWVLLGLGVALIVGRIVRRGEEERRFFGSLRARHCAGPPRQANRSSIDRGGSSPADGDHLAP